MMPPVLSGPGSPLHALLLIDSPHHFVILLCHFYSLSHLPPVGHHAGGAPVALTLSLLPGLFGHPTRGHHCYGYPILGFFVSCTLNDWENLM
jgi:hypothetical protein